jgi:hypothetical protein
VADDLLSAVVANHPYRNAMLGDLAEDRAQIEKVEGAEVAEMWYRGQALRTTFSLLPTLTIEPAKAARLICIVLGAYAIAVRATNVGAFAIGRALGTASGALFAALYATAVAIVGAIAARLVRHASRTPLLGNILLISVALAIGALHVAAASHGEVWFRMAKVTAFVVAMVATSLRSI